MPSRKAAKATPPKADRGSTTTGDAATLLGETAVHRRVLRTINEAVRPEDLLAPEPAIPHAEVGGFQVVTPAGEDHGADSGEQHEPAGGRERAQRLALAAEILRARDELSPLGLRHLKELDAKLLDHRLFPDLFAHLTHLFQGSWEDFPVDIPRRGPGSYSGVIHAALCHTSKVLFVTADLTTVLWDPANTTPSTFEDPTNQPHLMPNGYSQLCGHHVFLSSGKLLSMGGGGYSYNVLARAGYVFDPPSKTWARTANDMSEPKWYPTAVALGDEGCL